MKRKRWRSRIKITTLLLTGGIMFMQSGFLCQASEKGSGAESTDQISTDQVSADQVSTDQTGTGDQETINLQETGAEKEEASQDHTEASSDSANAYYEYILDETGKNVMGSDGYAMIEKETDEMGRVIRETYLNLDHKAVIAISKGCSTILRSYDADGNIIRESYLGILGEEIEGPDGYASFRKEYDDQKNVIQEVYYDTKGNLIPFKN